MNTTLLVIVVAALVLIGLCVTSRAIAALLVLASLAATGYGLATGSGGVVVAGVIATLITGALMQMLNGRHAAVKRDRAHWG